MEKWQDIKGCEGEYQISNEGRVKSLKRNKILTPREHQKGYLQVHLRVSGKDIVPKVHRLVAEAFIDNPDNLPQVNHILNQKGEKYGKRTKIKEC